MSGEASVNESSGEPVESTVSDAMVERDEGSPVEAELAPGELTDQAMEVIAVAEESREPTEPERKAGIQGAMRQTARENQARKSALKTAHLAGPVDDDAE